MDDQQGPSVPHRGLCSLLCCGLEGRGAWGRMDTRIPTAKIPCCPPETVNYHNTLNRLLLLLSRSVVSDSEIPQTADHQAPPSLGFSRREHWSGLPFPSPMHESEKWKWSRSVRPDSSDPMDCSPPGSSVHGIFQARVLEWVAVAFSVLFPLLMCIRLL